MKKPGKPKNPYQLVRTHFMVQKAVLERLRLDARINDRTVSAELNRILKDALQIGAT